MLLQGIAYNLVNESSLQSAVEKAVTSFNEVYGQKPTHIAVAADIKVSRTVAGLRLANRHMPSRHFLVGVPI